MTIDPYILTFSALTVIATVWMGFWAARKSKTASDFYVAGRSVSVGWNASAISGEYLSAASFMGVAGMVMSSGYDALWYPVCYACGYLFLLLFIAGPLRRFGAYTIPDFAEGRYDSTVFRKIAVVFVLFIGFFYTMPQMKGAGTTLAYIFPGLPYWAGVVLVGAVITLNVALGGMKGITLVQAFQYWAKMFAISVPVFVLMAVYGHYGKQIEENSPETRLPTPPPLLVGKADSQQDFRRKMKVLDAVYEYAGLVGRKPLPSGGPGLDKLDRLLRGRLTAYGLLKGPLLPSDLLDFTPPIDAVSLTGKWLSTEAIDVGMSLAPASEPNFTGIGKPTPEIVARFLTETTVRVSRSQRVFDLWKALDDHDIELMLVGKDYITPRIRKQVRRQLLPAKAPADKTWLNPFGPLTTKAARNGLAVELSPEQITLLDTNRYLVLRPISWEMKWRPSFLQVALRPLSEFGRRITGQIYSANGISSLGTGMRMYTEFSQRQVFFEKSLTNLAIQTVSISAKSRDQMLRQFESMAASNSVAMVRGLSNTVWAVPATVAPSLRSALNTLQTKLRPVRLYALVYTYSLIIALVCGTAGLPHILVRFYTNPDGVAAKRTTMWVMILIGVFYLFPPIFGVMGRNLLPELYAGAGAKGTDKVVLELPRILNQSSERGEKQASERRSVGASERAESERSPRSDVPHARTFPWGSILSGITCAGAFAAFMSTFSGLLVSMTGALAHDVYGRMLRPKSTPEQRMRAFRICAVIVGAVAILLGMQVEPFQINFMVGQAFAIAAASYFPLLFMSAWWRGMTMKGAATGMLTGGTLALLGISLTSFSDLKWLPLDAFWAAHPLARILCEQPAIWTVPLAITLMIVVSKLTAKEIPADIRMKMLVLHAPEKLGLKQEYIQEHQHGH
jgi:Na+(H+)/acetate symporter ActP